MVRVTYITFDGAPQTVDVQPGYSLMEGAIGNGVDGIDAACGGNSYCGTCRVYVDPAWRDRTGEMSETEQLIISSMEDDDPSVRLSCQVPVVETLDGLVVRLPKRQQ